MPRSINTVASKYRRKKILNASKGFSGARSKLFSVAKNAVEKSLQYAYAGVRAYYFCYSKFIGILYGKKIPLNRKVLADMAGHHPEAFQGIIEEIK